MKYPNTCFKVICGKYSRRGKCTCITCIHHIPNMCSCCADGSEWYNVMNANGYTCSEYEKDWVRAIKWKDHVNR